MNKVDVTMPQMGESITEGTIIKWLKKEGEKIEQDEILLEISTDKVDSEIPSPHTGVVKKIFVPEGETVEVGDKIAEIETDGAEADEDEKDKKDKLEAKKGKEKEKEPAKEAEAKTKKEKEDEEEKGARVYSPLVRSIAKAENISEEELESIEGSGPNGRVTKQDILNYVKKRAKKEEETEDRKEAGVTPPEPEFVDERTEVIPMGTMRKSIAEHMVRSVKTSPHVFAVSEADMTELVHYRTANKENFIEKTGTILTYMPFIVQACTKALLDFPLVNSSVDGDKIVRKKYINIGVAVALENSGLIVPVIKNADDLSLVGLAKAVNDLATRARSKKLKPDEVQDGTFSITNMGSFGSIMGLPIINKPQVAILGVGVIQKRPVVIADAIAIRDTMYISLSFDHRIVDGALAGQFLDRVAQYLTNFDTDNIL